jgi:serine/threonine-protein kinase
MGEQATRLSDIYALGVVAYQCLAGRRPFEGDNPLEIAMRHVRETPPPLPPDIPPNVRSIVDRAMAKEPSHRWPSAAAFAAVARQAAAELAAAGGRTAAAPASPAAAPRPVSGAPASPAVPVGGATRSMPPRPVASAPVTPAGAAPVYPRVGQPPIAGYLQQPVPRQGASTGLIVAIIVAVVLVAICVGAAIAIWQNAQQTQGLGPRAGIVVLDREGRTGL